MPPLAASTRDSVPLANCYRTARTASFSKSFSSAYLGYASLCSRVASILCLFS